VPLDQDARKAASVAYWQDVKQGLQSSIMALLDVLCPTQGNDNNGVYTALNPTRADKKPGSFVVWTRAPKAVGSWVDYATGDKGDVIDLVAYCLGCSAKEAVTWGAAWLGIPSFGGGKQDAETQAKWRANLEARAAKHAELMAQRAALDEAERNEKAASALCWWLGASPLAGSLGELYLREARGIDLSLLPREAGAIRFDPALKYREQGSKEVSEWPGLLSAMTLFNPDDLKGGSKSVRAVHRTFLARDGLGKAPVNKPKKMWGPKDGAAIRVSKGNSRLSPDAACLAMASLDYDDAMARGIVGTLAIGEGIEDALSVAIIEPSWRVWAAGDLGNIAKIIWPDCADRIVIIGQNDDHQEARDALEAARQALLAQARGRRLDVWRPVGCKDANDLLRRKKG
jgi:hypothetical protein